MGDISEPTTDAVELPEQPQEMVGRGTLLESVVTQLTRPEIRLVTLTGCGGVGKTRLACEVARRVAPGFDLVRFIDLAPLRSDQVLVAIADAVGVQLRPGSGEIDRLSSRLRTRRTLLLLDNFEHVLDVAPLVARLLVKADDLNLIVTSREPLRLRWEYLVRVPPLALPDTGEDLAVPEIARVPAVALFVKHVQRMHPDFALDEENASLVAALCRRLDGLPLALELAAAKLQVCSTQQLRALLNGSLDSFSFSLRDLPDRQLSVRASIEWSFQRLTPIEQCVACQAAVFAGGGSLEAARQVIELDPEAGPLEDMLFALAEKNLITFIPSQDDAPRFSMLGTVREYLFDQLESEEVKAGLAERYAAYFVDLAASVAGALGGLEDRESIQALHRERDNFRSILQRSIECGNLDNGHRLAVALTEYWYRSGQLAEAICWFEKLLEHCDSSRLVDRRIEILIWAGRFAQYRGNLRAAATYLDEILSLSKTVKCIQQRLEAARDLAHIRLAMGDVPAAEAILADMSSWLGADANITQVAELRFLHGSILAAGGGVDRARRLLSEARASFIEEDVVERAVGVTLALADLDLLNEAVESAEQLYSESVARASQARMWRLEARGHIGLGIVASRRHNEAAMLNHLTEAFENTERHGDELGLALVVDALSTLGLTSSLLRPEWLQFAGLAEAMFERLGMAETALERQRTASHNQMVRDILGDDEIARLEADGRRLSPGYVRAKLAEVRPEGHASVIEDASGSEGVFSDIERLTRREREVVRLVARGLTNRQIALELDIAERTVDSHVTNIFRKLEMTSRVSVAAWAVERGLANR